MKPKRTDQMKFYMGIGGARYKCSSFVSRQIVLIEVQLRGVCLRSDLNSFLCARAILGIYSQPEETSRCFRVIVTIYLDI